MHYRNGRKADYGDMVVVLHSKSSRPWFAGILECGPGGQTVVVAARSPSTSVVAAVSLCDCIHVDDVGRLIEAAWPLVQPMVSSTPNEDSHATDRP